LKTRNIEKEVTGILYLKLVYAIIAVGKMSDMSKMTRKNPPELQLWGGSIPFRRRLRPRLAISYLSPSSYLQI